MACHARCALPARCASPARLVGAVLLAFLAARPCFAEHSVGTVDIPRGGEVFISKFVFDRDPSEVVGIIDISLTAKDAAVRFVLFDDESTSYHGGDGEWTRESCDQKVARSRGSHEVISGQTKRIHIVEKTRRRWWYFALMDCSGTGASVSYDLHVWNPLRGWQAEFSMDRQGVLPLFCVLLCLYCALSAFQLKSNAAGRGAWGPEWSSNPVVRMLTASVLGFAGASFLFSMHYGCYAVIGRGLFSAYAAAKLLQALAKFSLMSIMLLLARGRCVSYALTANDVWQLAKLLLPFLALCIGLEYWGESAQSRIYTTDYVYDTPLGGALILVDLFLFVVFLVSLRATHRMEAQPEKKRFYTMLGLACAPWFLALPFAALLGVLLSPWVRTKILLTVTHAAHASACAAVVSMLRPSRATYMDATGGGIRSEVPAVEAGLLGREVEIVGVGVKLALGPLQPQPGSLELGRA